MNAHAAHTVDDVPRRLLSVTDLSRMIEAGIIGDEENVELIDGELIVMAAKKARHELMKSAVLRRLIKDTSDDIYVGVEASLRLDDYSMPEPDILVCRRADLVPSEEGYLTTGLASALLLIEVSDTTIRYDRVRKAALYARHAVPEYWVVDVDGPVLWIHREPRDGAYVSVMRRDGHEPVRPGASELAHVSFRLADLE